MIDWIRPRFVPWGYLIVFAGTFLENAAFVGAVIPGDIILLLGGFYSAQGELSLPRVIAVAFTGAILGDSVGYVVGRVAGRRIVERFGDRFFLPRRRVERMERYFREYGMWAVALGRVAPAIRTVNTFAAGMTRMAYPRFLLAAGMGAAVWSVTVPTLGLAFSESLEFVERSLGAGGIVFLLLVVALVVFTYRRMMRRLREETEG